VLIVIDSNILFSALIRDSTTRKLILEYGGFFLFPEYIFIEVEKYKSELLTKSKLNEEEFNKLLELILKKVMVVQDELLNPHYGEARRLAESVESPEDLTFFACALAYPESIIWSNDQKLKRQTKVKIISTSEMLNFF